MATTHRQQTGLACEECRRRKSKCDRVRPCCGGCSELGADCIFVEDRPKRGPKKGQLRALRSRIATLEQQLALQAGLEPADVGSYSDPAIAIAFQEIDYNTHTGVSQLDWVDESCDMADASMPAGWQHTALILHETLDSSGPLIGDPFKMLDPLRISSLTEIDLDQLYFERIHPMAPMIHKRRYYSWVNQENISPARRCLRSAMRTIASAMSSQLRSSSEAFYAETYRMLEELEGGELSLPWTKGEVRIEQIQAWLLLAYYEFLSTQRNQSLMTVERVLRLVQLSRLYSVDTANRPTTHEPSLQDTTCSSDAPDETFAMTEEKRRTFWLVFCTDRLFSPCSKAALTLSEEIISTRLPAPESNFQDSRQVEMNFLAEAINNGCSGPHSWFADFVHLTALYGRCMIHRRMGLATASIEKESRAFWVRHDWLAAAAEEQAGRFQEVVPASSGFVDYDPIQVVCQMLPQNIVIYLGNTNDMVQWKAKDQQLKALEYEQKASRAAVDIAGIAKSISNLSCFKAHPFLVEGLLSAGTFLVTHPGPAGVASSNEMWEAGIRQVGETLGYLAKAQGVAQEALDKLELGVPDDNF